MSGKRLIKIFKNIEECPVEYTGHLPNRFKDIKGEQYNNLKVLYLVGFKNHRSEWLCQCNCGNYVIVNSHNLRTGHTKSCGCLISEKLRYDLTGKQFGYLKVLKYIGSKNESPVYEVQCLNCGRIYEAYGNAIQKQFSCGCILSKAAQIILNTFKNSSIGYINDVITEKTYDDCYFKDKLKFDFCIPKSSQRKTEMLFEYDGIQHYQPVQFSKTTTISEAYKNFVSNQIRDWIKDKYCIDNNIPLIRIKYTTSKNPKYKDIYDNSYIVGKAQGSDNRINILGLIDNDFINNKNPTFNILAGISCTFKCCRDNPSLCHNCDLTKQPIIECAIDGLINRYLNQSISRSITFQGLECLDNIKQIMWFIVKFRNVCDDPIFIWTGYTKEECEDFIYLLKDYLHLKNIIVKFGRYIPGQQPHYDSVLGVNLASDNQYAEVIS